MAFTQRGIEQFEEQAKKALGALLYENTVEVFGKTGTIQVKLSVNSRRGNQTELTGGATSETNLICVIDADDWDAKVGRMPQRGDVVHWHGRRHAIERPVPVAPAGNAVFYRARLEG